jgi:diaminohydroxyphosphoribosylaminopyrimidine deaminase/5-amino-6-(5-phosphoribosylamino)uracil reductase
LKGKERERRLMLEALAEAEKGKGKTFPNPAVGAVVVSGESIVGRGFHKRWGRPHAEVEALMDAGGWSRGADLYVTLEPCSHWGKTPPCTDAIIQSGIRRVIVPSIDPNPVVKGRGLRALRRAGIAVAVGPCAREARRLNEAYFKFMKTGLPFVTLKVAQTLDGKIATRGGEARWVTSAASRKMAKRMRAEAQAILVGVNTVRNDDPELLPVPRRKTYYRCVLDTDLAIPPGSSLVRTARRHPTIVFCADPGAARARRLEAGGVMVRQIGKAPDGLLRLEEVVSDLGRLGVMHLLVEGGGLVSSSFLKAGLEDRLAVFIAPKILGDPNGLGAFHNLDVKHLRSCYAFNIDEVGRAGEDVVIMLYPRCRRGGR